MDKKQLIGNEKTETPPETPERLNAMIAAYQRALHGASSDKERLKDLLERRSANKWDAAKKAKMVRRYMRADQDVTESTSTILQLQDRLSQLGTASP